MYSPFCSCSTDPHARIRGSDQSIGVSDTEYVGEAGILDPVGSGLIQLWYALAMTAVGGWVASNGLIGSAGKMRLADGRNGAGLT